MPTKSDNKTLLQYPAYLRGQWNFGGVEDEEKEGEKSEEEANVDVVDIVKTGRGLVLRRVEKLGCPAKEDEDGFKTHGTSLTRGLRGPINS